MSGEKVIDLDATLKRLAGPHHYRTVILSLDEAADLLALLDEARQLLAVVADAERGTDLKLGVVGWRIRQFLAHFSAPSPTDEETTR